MHGENGREEETRDRRKERRGGGLDMIRKGRRVVGRMEDLELIREGGIL